MMKTRRTIWMLALGVILPAWADCSPTHAQQHPTGPAPLGGSSRGGFPNRQDGRNAVNANLNGGLSDAFGNPSAYQRSLGAPIPGQPYQIPGRYANDPPGTVITWGRYRYQLGSDGTMTSAGPVPGQHYQIPDQFANQAPGTVITKGRYRYLLGSDGTMTSYNGPEPSTNSTATQRNSRSPVPGERYQIPAEHASAVPGSVIKYHGNHYVVSKDGTMTALASSP